MMARVATKKRTKRRKSKLGHVPILARRRLSSLIPAHENDELYRPVVTSDPEVQALAESIRTIGLQEPIVVTTDNHIVSGHRRRVACQIAGLEVVPVRVLPICRSDLTAAEWVQLIREHNRQRVKTLAEVTREEVVSADPEEAYRLLTAHREAAAAVDIGTIEIRGTKRRAEISDAKQPFLDAVLAILEERRKFLPLTVRQIHYALLNAPPLIHASKADSRYQNTPQCYKAAVDLVARARLSGLIPWAAVQDETRPAATWNAHSSIATFIRAEVDGFLKGYYRDLLQSQPNQIEIVGEKNTIQGIIRPVAARYRVPYCIGRGYASLPPRQMMAERFHASGKEKLVLLVLSDFDPSGEDIAHSFARSMRDDFGVEHIVPVKVGLTREQIDRLDLPPQMTAKTTDSRHDGFVERHGEEVYELEAVPPGELQAILAEAIDLVLDVPAFNAEIEAEKRDAAHLDGVRRAVQQQLKNVEFE